MSWRWEQLPPPGTRPRVHLVAFFTQHRAGATPTPIDPSLRELALRDLEVDVGDVLLGETITTEALDPPNLDYLRDAWRRAAQLRATYVLDVLARRWWSVLASDRPFFLENELSLNFEGQPTANLGHLAHTVGMAKFGRPELAIAGLTPPDGPAGAELLLRAARIVALGGSLKIGPRILDDALRAERNTLPIAAPHFVIRDAGMGPPTVRRYLELRRG